MMRHPLIDYIPLSDIVKDEITVLYRDDSTAWRPISIGEVKFDRYQLTIRTDHHVIKMIYLINTGGVMTYFSDPNDTYFHREDGPSVVENRGKRVLRVRYHLHGKEISTSAVQELLGETPERFSPEQAMLFNLTFGGGQ